MVLEKVSLELWSSYPFDVLAGPALYAFNDAAFTEEDWEGIQRAGRSIKQDDPTKVGRFGIGFNSVYHVTGEEFTLVLK